MKLIHTTLAFLIADISSQAASTQIGDLRLSSTAYSGTTC